MAFFKKKKRGTGPMPEELPPLPPIPGEEELTAPEPLPREPKLKPAPAIPEVSMAAPAAPKAPAVVAPSEKATVFVRIDKYRELMKSIEAMQDKIGELSNTLERISSIKEREGEIIDGWHAMLSDAKSKLDEVSAKLTKPEA